MPKPEKRRKDAAKRISSPEQRRLREEILRPSPYLGYDRYVLAVHMIQCEAFGAAESELRHAVWLNPYEPRFKVYLALCLYRQKRYPEARQWIAEVPENQMTEQARDMKRLLEKTEAEQSGEDHSAL